jgi:hypothetical protein
VVSFTEIKFNYVNYNRDGEVLSREDIVENNNDDDSLKSWEFYVRTFELSRPLTGVVRISFFFWNVFFFFFF